MSAVGSGVFAVKAIDPIGDEQRAPITGPMRMLMEREVFLSDEFLCVVTISSASAPGALAFPHYITCLEFTGRELDSKGAFLFEVTTSECKPWQPEARCRIWSLVSEQQALDELSRLGVVEAVRPAMSIQDQLAGYLHYAPDLVRAVSALADPLWHCVPSELQETGLLTHTNSKGLDYLHELDGFPLSQLASAIRTAAQKGNWETVAPPTLFPSSSETTLTVDEQNALAQSLILRLVAELPERP